MGYLFCYAPDIKWQILKNLQDEQEEMHMKGYTTSAGYMGWVEGRYILFASECEYREYIEE